MVVTILLRGGRCVLYCCFELFNYVYLHVHFLSVYCNYSVRQVLVVDVWTVLAAVTVDGFSASFSLFISKRRVLIIYMIQNIHNCILIVDNSAVYIATRPNCQFGWRDSLNC